MLHRFTDWVGCWYETIRITAFRRETYRVIREHRGPYSWADDMNDVFPDEDY